VDVSGDAGGSALIGSNYQGKGSEQHAQNVTGDKATIKAHAISRGNGGKVALWSDGSAWFAGSVRPGRRGERQWRQGRNF
jgi:hypothetical protein